MHGEQCGHLACSMHFTLLESIIHRKHTCCLDLQIAGRKKQRNLLNVVPLWQMCMKAGIEEMM